MRMRWRRTGRSCWTCWCTIERRTSHAVPPGVNGPELAVPTVNWQQYEPCRRLVARLRSGVPAGDDAVDDGHDRATNAHTVRTLVYGDREASPMGTISVYLPDDLEAELEEYAEAKHLDRTGAVRKLLRDRLERWRTERAIQRLRDGDVTFSGAAEMADLNVWEFANEVHERDATWVSGEHVERDLADQ